MTTDAGRVEIDTSKLERFTRNLADALQRDGALLARTHAERTATEIRRTVPKRTGRLAASVAVTSEPDGFGVSYGAGVPYAGYIEKRSGAVADATDGAADPFYRDAVDLAQSSCRRLS